MKSYLLVVFLLVTGQFISAQGFLAPLYFQDGVGNKDSVYFGYHPSAQEGINT